jgi:hypothetical protein
MNVLEATAKYEKWLGKHLLLLDQDLKRKHVAMRDDVFQFFRATYYRWAQLWPEVCAEESAAPSVLAVGDLHVENFGTWRDAEGRLVWGINDFDEAWPLAYTNDLVRLIASASLAGMALRRAVSPVLEGYRHALKEGGRPLVLAENHLDLRHLAVERLKDPGKYWARLDSLPDWKGKVPKGAVRALYRMLPAERLDLRIVHRVAGLGSLGRERYVALVHADGGLIAREAKALAPSASAWAEGRRGSPQLFYEEVLDRSVRSRDPFVRMRGRWIVRRLAPDCSRIELSDLPKERDEERLLYYMGWETANVHLGRGRARLILADLKKRKGNWLAKAAAALAEACKADWREWRKA